MSPSGDRGGDATCGGTHHEAWAVVLDVAACWMCVKLFVVILLVFSSRFTHFGRCLELETAPESFIVLPEEDWAWPACARVRRRIPLPIRGGRRALC